MQDRHAARGGVLGFAGITGIEKPHPVNYLVERLVRVAKDHHVRSGPRQANLQFVIQGIGVDDVLHQKF